MCICITVKVPPARWCFFIDFDVTKYFWINVDGFLQNWTATTQESKKSGGCIFNAHCFYGWQSKFEFQLRLQEYVELVRAEDHLRAITYARKYLAPWAATHMKEMQRVFAIVAFKGNPECAVYKVTWFQWIIAMFYCKWHHSSWQLWYTECYLDWCMWKHLVSGLVRMNFNSDKKKLIFAKI